ncbi:retrovirus-related Pol polyprotein from transposon TNT 1-94 [Senna tora]|uniref:Retrovirus-related Pol polyprotein from transposon TNT 1-94 n=1 Tax=Senna tora TaxID=362788 RepID=A0A834WAT0_9FABA|nr:retrovirus-related Pol polyprotein from transposon TNT 1-94 [Senna tora]
MNTMTDGEGKKDEGQSQSQTYLIWTALRARKKFGFVRGTIQRPDEMSDDLKDWWTINSLLVSWIYNLPL